MQLTKEQYEQCWNEFQELGEEGLYKTHYQLAQETHISDALLWKNFLMDPRTVDYISTEMNIIRNATVNYMVSQAGDSNSVGQSQLLNALQKIDEKASHKDGPTFIYMYVPLNEEQKKAPNVRSVNTEGVEIEEEDGTWTMTIEE